MHTHIDELASHLKEIFDEQQEGAQFNKEVVQFNQILAEIGNFQRPPKVFPKYGGYVATYYSNQTIGVRVDSWRKLNLFQKRLVVIHEVLHFLGVSHSQMGAIAYRDLIGLEVYRRIYGEEQEYSQGIAQVKKATDLLAGKLNF